VAFAARKITVNLAQDWSRIRSYSRSTNNSLKNEKDDRIPPQQRSAIVKGHHGEEIQWGQLKMLDKVQWSLMLDSVTAAHLHTNEAWCPWHLPVCL